MKKLLLIALCFIAVSLVSCGDEEESVSIASEKTKSTDIKELIVGYWSGFSSASTALPYSFASFNKDGDYAIYLNDDMFSSGTYTVNDSTITLYDGYNGVYTSVNIKVTDKSLSFMRNGISYNGNKTEKDPIDLNYIFIGKSYTFYFFLKPTPLTFNTKYAATQEYQYSTTRTLSIYWQYVYDGYSQIYAKKYNDTNVHTTVGGYNDFTKGKVYIYKTEISEGNVVDMELLNTDK